MKKLVWFMTLFLWTCAGGKALAQAPCTGSDIVVVVSPTILKPIIPVIWRIEPRCDVIETGLLVGTDTAALAPVGQPIYGDRDAYWQEVQVAESGAYWVVAYARDESGGLIQSAPQPVLVMVPPSLPSPSGGSHGAPSFYTGTDGDFLKPAGEPHFASLKAVTSVTAEKVVILGAIFRDRASRLIADTQRDPVLAEQSESLPFGHTTDLAAVRTALDQLDSRFSTLRFPRPGLYAVRCGYQRFSPDAPRKGCAFEAITLPQPVIGVNVGHVNLHVSDNSSGASGISNVSFDSFSVTFFVPASSPTKRVKTARLRVFFTAGGPAQDIPSGLRLNGKPPVATEGMACLAHPNIPGTITCSGIATWDFTDEVRSLTQGGGGEFLVSPEVTPPLVLTLDRLYVNYPWAHGNELGSLRLTFEEACPRQLALVVMSPFVQPRGLPVSLAVTQAIIEARVTNLPARSRHTATERRGEPRGGTACGRQSRGRRSCAQRGTTDGEVCTACWANADKLQRDLPPF